MDNNKKTDNSTPVNPYAAEGTPGAADYINPNVPAQTPSPNTPAPTSQSKTEQAAPYVPRSHSSDTDPRATIITLVVIVVAIIGIVMSYFLNQYFAKNPYGEETVIDNFSQYFNKVPKDQRDKIFAGLHRTIKSNLPEDAEVPVKGALVREDTSRFTLSPESGIYYGAFAVDIPSVRQSYNVQFEYPSNNEVNEMSGYSLLFTCVKGSEVIYEDFVCVDMFTEEEEEAEEFQQEYPLNKFLPIDIDYYDQLGNYISYRIAGHPITSTDGKIQGYRVVITDRSGGNYEKALDRIRGLTCGDKPCNPNDYTIEYKNQSEKEAYAGNS